MRKMVVMEHSVKCTVTLIYLVSCLFNPVKGVKRIKYTSKK